jgi:hypothetical protein
VKKVRRSEKEDGTVVIDLLALGIDFFATGSKRQLWLTYCHIGEINAMRDIYLK